MEKITNIRISFQTRKHLNTIGRKNQTYDEIINEIITHVNSCDQFWSDRS